MRLLARVTRAPFPTQHDVEDLFMRLDVDGDKTISSGEFSMLIKSLTPIFEESGIRVKIKRRVN